MKTAIAALGLSVLLCVTLYVAVGVIASRPDLARDIAVIPLIGITGLYSLLEKYQEKRKLSVSPKSIATFAGFSIPWYVVIVVGTIAFFGIMNVSAFAGGLAAALLFPEPTWLAVTFATQAVLSLIGAYLLGHWVGGRCAASGIFPLMAAIFLGRTLALVPDFLALSPEQLERLFSHKGPKNVVGFFQFAIHAWYFSWVYFLPGLAGWWMGRQARLSKYLAHLLGIVPADTRTTIVDLAYEEAQRVGKHAAGEQQQRPT